LVAGAANSYALLALGVALAGFGNSVFHPADYAIMNARVSAGRLGYAYSAHGVVGFLGYAVAPLFSVGLAVAFNWHVALIAGAALGLVLLVVLLAGGRHLEVRREAVAGPREPLLKGGRVLLAAPVLLCFAYFTIYAAGLSGVQSFGVAAVIEQYGVSPTFASGVLTAYLIGAASGILAGGFVATRVSRHDVVAAAGLAASGLVIFLVAGGMVPGSALQVAFALAGFGSGIIAPSRDMLVRASTPPGATGRVFGFVYSGLDVGFFVTPVFFGWLLDRQMPQAVFYAVFGFMLLAMLMVLQLPGRAQRAAAQSA
jgi:MFS transporter, FSR family, fosmidomycin resistance protein